MNYSRNKVLFALGFGGSLLLPFAACSQGTFQNLNFESATIQQTAPPSIVSSLDAVPGWTVCFGTNQQSQIGYNLISLGNTWVTLLGTNGSGGATSIEGGFSVGLQGGGIYPDATIRQTGLVPVGTHSIQFKAVPGSAPLVVSLNAQIIPLSVVFAGPSYNIYGGDISQFAGQSALLQFSAPEDLPIYNDWLLDSIAFSGQQIPEPSTCSLILLSLVAFGWKWRGLLGDKLGKK